MDRPASGSAHAAAIVSCTNSALATVEPIRLAGEQAPVRRALPMIYLLAAGCSLPATLLPRVGRAHRVPNQLAGELSEL